MSPLFSLKELESAFSVVRQLVPHTPSYAWPLLEHRLRLKVFVKHENHTPIGAFKARSSICFLHDHIECFGAPEGVITATRGNHGQSMALAARRLGLPSTIVVPLGNADGKNRAMQGFGGNLVVAGADFDESRRIATEIAEEKGLLMVPPFHRTIALGVGTYAHELFGDVPDLDVVYVPIGMGSGVSGLITVRDLLGLETEIVPVVSAHAPAYQKSFEARKVIETATAHTFADGMACRQPLPEVLDLLLRGVRRIVCVTDDEIADAIRIIFADTHNLAEGAGAAALAALVKERERHQGKRAGVVLTGGNFDEDMMSTVLAGRTPQP